MDKIFLNLVVAVPLAFLNVYIKISQFIYEFKPFATWVPGL